MKGIPQLVLLVLSLAAACAVHGQVKESAASYPSKPVRAIVPIGPGGTADTIARLASAYFLQRYQQPVIVDNRPGANGQIGTEAVVKSPADGYTLLMTTNGLVLEEAVNKEWPFRIERDLTVITIVGGSGLVVAASNKLPVNNLRELVAYSKANPGKLNEAGPAQLGVTIAILRHALGMAPVEVIIYKGGAAAAQAVVSGEVDFYGGSVGDVTPLFRAGRLKALAYTARQRNPLLPEVPTVNEAGVGLTDFDGSSWYGVMAPAGLPSDFVDKLQSAFADLYKLPEYADKMAATGLANFSFTPTQARERIALMKKQYQDAMAAGIKLR